MPVPERFPGLIVPPAGSPSPELSSLRPPSPTGSTGPSSRRPSLRDSGTPGQSGTDIPEPPNHEVQQQSSTGRGGLLNDSVAAQPQAGASAQPENEVPEHSVARLSSTGRRTFGNNSVAAQGDTGASGQPENEAPEQLAPRGPSDAGVLFYDGECTFCQRSVHLLQKSARRPIVAVPSSAFSQHWPRELRQAAEEEVIWINARGEAVGGVLAVAAALRAAGRSWLASLLAFPPLLPLTRMVYRWVARNRYRFSRACAVDLPKRPTAPIGTARETTLLPKPLR